ncbi:Wzz/FepE/Etk N-terminal domain-containing protein [Bacteroides sp. 224]|uniref:Wzz/FepE/Etk N-terminal domain-containing protein n=1 Tax=Bacteroides sp. 224 TaxID=2302936 RepID=UPI0013D05AB8|nr:Wzz/FepE/Etk N-terminal domain-containing protein [Bacteroides sp. 224]NDV64361.1 chain-length determining protein [Bacteroides sp. 224]
MKNEEKMQDTSSKQSQEQEIDLIELAQKIWDERKLVFKWCGIAALIGIVVAFSIPKEYTTTVTITPETGSKGVSGGMGALAAMAGVNIGMQNSEDAIYPELYPDIVSSTPFLTDLFDVNITDIKGKLGPNLTVYTYLDEHQRAPWWSAVISAPFKVLGWFTSLFKDEEVGEKAALDPFMLTRDEANIAKALSSRISVSVDKKTGVATISVLMQDPLISATLTDTVMYRLQNYITDYRTNKARHDLAFTQKLHDEAKEKYYIAQQKYAKAMDANLNIAKQSYRTELDRLQNEMSLTYGIYNQVAQQLQMAKAKVQDITPVYTVLQPATVPLQATKPRKPMILIGFVFLAGVASVGWILFIKDFVKNWKKKPEQ